MKFSNRGIAQEIPRVLNELGYVVDIVNFDNGFWRPRQHYDLFIGHGGINFERICHDLMSTIPKIYLATGTYWREANRRLTERLTALAARRGRRLSASRAVSHSEDFANVYADGIVCIGNKVVAQSYPASGLVASVSNAIYPVVNGAWRTKDYDKGRKHFLFFSGRGNVLKGLDVILEAFDRTDLHLHICQRMEREFVDTYRSELRRHNIHLHGFVRMRSGRFYRLVRQCNWIISATCTEGQPGAILECMGHGLIPVLPDTANIEVARDNGVRLDNCDVRAIRDVIVSASAKTVEECRSMSQRVGALTATTYSVEAFRRQFRAGVEAIVVDKSPCPPTATGQPGRSG